MSFEKILDAMITGGIWLFGGASYYLYLVSKWKQFRFGMFCINLFLAFFIGYVAGRFLPVDGIYRDWMIAISGFCSFPILETIEKNFTKYIFDKITK